MEYLNLCPPYRALLKVRWRLGGLSRRVFAGSLGNLNLKALSGNVPECTYNTTILICECIMKLLSEIQVQDNINLCCGLQRVKLIIVMLRVSEIERLNQTWQNNQIQSQLQAFIFQVKLFLVVIFATIFRNEMFVYCRGGVTNQVYHVMALLDIDQPYLISYWLIAVK